MNNDSKIDFSKIPSRMLTHQFTDGVIDFLFPLEPSLQSKEEQEKQLREILLRLLMPIRDKVSNSPETIVSHFISQLKLVYEKLLSDANWFLKSDPAAECIEEVVLAYPGFYAIAVYRIAHELVKLNVPILPRVITEYAHNKTGIDIHPGATIGTPLFIDHGTGVVIGQTTIIGDYVKIYQGVTLGALAVRKDSQGAKRHPSIEDYVIIYAGSCILGGDTSVGRNSVIGGNVWLTESVAPFSVVYHKSDVHIRDKSEMNDVIDFVI